jgi:hypothetical protein
MTVIPPPAMGESKTGRSSRMLCRLISYVVFFFAFFCAIGLVESLLVPRAIDSGIAVPLGEAFFVDMLVTTAYILVSIFLEERNPVSDEHRGDRKTASKPIPCRKSA